MFAPSVEQAPTAMTTPVAERKTGSRYRVFISAPVCQVEEEREATVAGNSKARASARPRGKLASLRRAAPRRLWTPVNTPLSAVHSRAAVEGPWRALAQAPAL